MGSKSNSATSSSTAYNTKTDNLNLQGIEGLAVAGNDGTTTVSILDAGAIDGALALAGNVTDEALDFGFAVNRDALDFGGKALDFVSINNANAVAALENGFDKNAQLFGQLANKVTLDSGERVQTVTQYALAAVGFLALMFMWRASRAG